MKFKFSLEQLKKFRKTQQEMAQTALQSAQYDLHLEVLELEKMQQQVQESLQFRFERQKSTEESSEPGASSTLAQVHDFLTGQKVRIERQKVRVQEAERRVEFARDFLREKSIEYKMMERLKEKELAEFKKFLRKKEIKDSDDLTVMRFANSVVNRRMGWERS